MQLWHFITVELMPPPPGDAELPQHHLYSRPPHLNPWQPGTHGTFKAFAAESTPPVLAFRRQVLNWSPVIPTPPPFLTSGDTGPHPPQSEQHCAPPDSCFPASPQWWWGGPPVTWLTDAVHLLESLRKLRGFADGGHAAMSPRPGLRRQRFPLKAQYPR